MLKTAQYNRKHYQRLKYRFYNSFCSPRSAFGCALKNTGIESEALTVELAGTPNYVRDKIGYVY